MKQLLTILCIMGVFISSAQEQQKQETKEERQQRYIEEVNPFRELGYKPKISTLSKGKYREAFPDSIVQIGNFTYNILEKRISGVTLFEELGISEATAKPEIVSRWMSPDPLSHEFPDVSPYNFVNNNPIRFIDPEGLAPFDIIGQTRSDARKFKDDTHAVLADSKFDNLRGLITTSGNKFDKIDSGALTTALDGVTLSKDEQAYVDVLVNTINSNETHVVEYASATGNISTDGKDAVVAHLNNTQTGLGNMLLKPDGTLGASVIEGLGGAGFNVPNGNGSHSIILEGSGITQSGGNRAVTSGHEVIGHGIPSARGLTPAQNNTNAIRTDNLIRRILGIPTRTGANHAGGKQGQITNPNDLPITN